MKANQFSPSANPRTSKAQIQTAETDLNQGKTTSPASPENHWLEAEAQLFGGVERESQMHPGSSLFKTEH
jgi:hypothetical protein